MTVKKALEYIHSVSWMGSRPGLSRTRDLLSLMGNPQNGLRFVHIAGTNGKGSVSAMITSILRAAGYRVGLYTSPYILRFNERMQVNGREISNKELGEITEYVKPFAESMEDHPTEFELVTAIGFEFFARKKCDIVVLEVGMGGELDSTNVIESPSLTVITEIDFDHMGVLGNSIEEIASAKAGIIKAGVPVVSADNIKAAAAVIGAKCAEQGCKRVTPPFEKIQNNRATETGIAFDYMGEEYKVPLLGAYQFRNALTAITAAKELSVRGYNITEKHIKKGLASVRWRGRFEILCRDPLFIYDGGHNPQGVAAAAESFALRYGKGVVLLGVMADKDYSSEIQTLLSIAQDFVTVTPDNPRALGAADLADKICAMGGRATAAKTVEEGVCLAAKIGGGKDPVLAVGSLYMYGEIYAAVKKVFLQNKG